jgi:hypothetical protein
MARPQFTKVAPFPGFFFEKQEGLGCGRHAINNLFQEVVYNITDTREINLEHPMFPMNLPKFCTKLVVEYYRIFGKERPQIYACESNENYSDPVIESALRLKGYDQIGVCGIWDRDDILTKNIGDNFILVHLPGHWTCARKLNGKFYYIDSMSGHIVFNTESELKEYLQSIITDIDVQIFIYEKKGDYIAPLRGGSRDDKYKQKYLKYKNKYLQLKNKLY